MMYNIDMNTLCIYIDIDIERHRGTIVAWFVQEEEYTDHTSDRPSLKETCAVM